MDLNNILSDSLKLLVHEPRFFAPKLFTMLLYTAFTVYSVGLTADFIAMQDPRAVSDFMWKIALLFSLLPLLYLTDVLTYAMYPSMVQDRINGRKVSLIYALKKAFSIWKTVFALTLTILAFLVLVSTVIFFLQFMSFMTGNQYFTLLAAASAVVLVIGFAVVVFFVVPSAVLDEKGVTESFKLSLKLAIAHKRELFKLNLVFTFLVSATVALLYASRYLDFYPNLSTAVFVLTRLIQTTVYTYVTVANPLAYMGLRVK